MLLLEIMRAERAVRATDLETHWTTYIAAEYDETVKAAFDELEGVIAITAHKQSTTGIQPKRLLAAFPKNSTIVILN